MNKFIQVLAVVLLTYVLCNAQDNQYKLDMKMVITAPDTQMITLNHNGDMNEIIEGYYFIPRYKPAFIYTTAALKAGGFSFLDPNVFGGVVDLLGEKWVKNKLQMEDVETMTNGMDIEKILSFQIKPVVVDEESDTLALFIKYAVYDFIEQKNFELDYNYNVKLFYKLVYIPFQAQKTFNFFNEHCRGHNIDCFFTKVGSKKKSFVEKEGVIFNEVLKSAGESKLRKKINFEIGLTRFDEMGVNQFSPIAQYVEQNLPSANTIKNAVTNDKVETSSDIYYGRLNFPFIIYNTQKAKLYKNFSTREKLFQSTYNFTIVPISMVNDSLTFDLFIDYSKLNLNDGIPRWTPIKKRLTIANERAMTSITLPKENWSANFTRKNEEYNIYGYSDVERFIKEQIYIKYTVLNDEAEL